MMESEGFLLPSTTPEANVVFSVYKFHPCIKAPELSPHSKMKQQPDMKNNIVKTVRFFLLTMQ